MVVASSLQNLTRQFGVKNPTDALQWVREHVGNATIFCGGTMATSSRGVSYYSEDKFGCPTTLLNVTIPRGHCTEGTSQAFMRFCGKCSLLWSRCRQCTSFPCCCLVHSSCSCTEQHCVMKCARLPRGCLL